MKNTLLTGFLMASAIFSYAQKSDGSTKSLLAAEQEFADFAKKNGEKSAFLKYTSETGLVFRPNPVNARTYYNGQTSASTITWKPVHAKISRSGDFGFTTGPYMVDGTEKEYGQYLSVWKARNGVWELALDMGVAHNKPLKPTTNLFVEPTGKYTPKVYGTKDAAVGMEIIYDTERTLNTTLKSYGVPALGGFVNADARLLFPGNEPIVGKDNILSYLNQVISKVNLKTTGAAKALGGELAYTYGIATVDYKADLRETFNYLFIWERQPDHNWNIIVQAFSPAVR